MIGMGLKDLSAYEALQRETGLTGAKLEAAFLAALTYNTPRDPRPYSAAKFLRSIYDKIAGAREHRGAEPLPSFKDWCAVDGYDPDTNEYFAVA